MGVELVFGFWSWEWGNRGAGIGRVLDCQGP